MNKKQEARAAGRGRPRTVNTPEKISDLLQKLDAYIEDTPVPIVAEFAYTNNISRADLYDNPEFSTLLKKLILKKESQLEKLALMNKINTATAIFSLKQLGWRDRQEHDITGGPLSITISNEFAPKSMQKKK